MNRIMPSKRQQSATRKVFDDFMYIVALVSPVMTIPQALLVWMHHQVAGLSLSTWVAYMLVSLAWLVYGLVRKQSALVLSQACTFVIDVGVVVGIVTFH